MGRRRTNQQLQQQIQQGFQQLKVNPTSDVINQGKDGRNGCDGRDGKHGQDGKDGRDGKDGFDGRDGIDGKDGIIPNIGIKVASGTLVVEDSISTVIPWVYPKYQNEMSINPNDSTITIPTAGKYDVGISVNWEQHTAGIRILGIIKNIETGGILIASNQNVGISDMYPQGMSVAVVEDFIAGDTITFFVHQTSGDDLKIGMSDFTTMIAGNIVEMGQSSAWIQYRSE